ncbi:MAG: RIP metalloprotease RseP [Clostridia bacterium]|nr:RIP metalloprotease RseP [Clostridia bacterium]
MINFIIIALKVIFLLGFLIFIHEGGHFIVAKLCKVKVNEFAIGFGPTIWKKQGKETKYALRLIPLGGFVNLEGEVGTSESKNSFTNASIHKRMAIILAGGIVNILFAIIVYFILSVSIGNNISLVVDQTIEGYSAKQSGIIEGDKILKINDKKIKVKSDIDKILNSSNGENLKLTIQRGNEQKEINLSPTKQEHKSTGIYLKSDKGENANKIIAIEKKSIAEKQGLKANDKIIKINDKQIYSMQDIVNEVNSNENDEKLVFTVKRGNENIQIELIPDKIYTYLLGVQFKKAPNKITTNMYYAIFETRDFLASSIDSLKMLFTGNVGLDQMMGPVGISETIANTKVIQDFIYLLALISLSLGITNLLPFPMLDGGKFVLLLVELITRKRIKPEVQVKIELLGMALLIMLSIYVTYNDILRII